MLNDPQGWDELLEALEAAHRAANALRGFWAHGQPVSPVGQDQHWYALGCARRALAHVSAMRAGLNCTLPDWQSSRIDEVNREVERTRHEMPTMR